jgi:hypothetical protein
MKTKASPEHHIVYLETNQQRRLNEARQKGIPWKKWGPYLSERQWGTVREDYSQDGNAWDYFSHDQSRSRAYQGETTVWRVSPMTNNSCVLRLRCGTAGIRF